MEGNVIISSSHFLWHVADDNYPYTWGPRSGQPFDHFSELHLAQKHDPSYTPPGSVNSPEAPEVPLQGAVDTNSPFESGAMGPSGHDHSPLGGSSGMWPFFDTPPMLYPDGYHNPYMMPWPEPQAQYAPSGIPNMGHLSPDPYEYSLPPMAETKALTPRDKSLPPRTPRQWPFRIIQSVNGFINFRQQNTRASYSPDDTEES